MHLNCLHCGSLVSIAFAISFQLFPMHLTNPQYIFACVILFTALPLIFTIIIIFHLFPNISNHIYYYFHCNLNYCHCVSLACLYISFVLFPLWIHCFHWFPLRCRTFPPYFYLLSQYVFWCRVFLLHFSAHCPRDWLYFAVLAYSRGISIFPLCSTVFPLMSLPVGGWLAVGVSRASDSPGGWCPARWLTGRLARWLALRSSPRIKSGWWRAGEICKSRAGSSAQ